ncbi:MAG TPA: autotransporter-associated beta strand repeat-containing protein [Humisphaera sp.]
MYRRLLLTAAASAAVALLSSVPATADTYNWQLAGPTNNWSTDPADANWFVNAGSTLSPWADGNAAVFAGTGEAVTLVGSVRPTTITVGSGNGNWTLTGTGTIDGATASLLKTGAGTLTLSNTTDNTFAGGTTINGGVLSLGTGGTGANTSTVAALGTGTVTVNAGGTLRLWIQNSGTFAYANPVVVDGGAVHGEDGINTLTGPLTIGAGGATLSSKWNGKTLTVSGPITGAGTLTVRSSADGGGDVNTAAVILSGDNSGFTGRTYVRSGFLRVATNNTALGTAPVTFVANSTLATAAGGGARTLANALIVNPGVTATLDSTNASLQFNGVISGGGAVAKTSAGDLVLNAANQYTGGTTIGGGVTRLGTNDSAFGSGAITVSGNATLATGSGLGARTVSNAVTINTGITLSADGGYYPITFAGPIGGPGNFARASSGTVILAAANTYAGTTNTGTSATGGLQVGDGGSSGTLGSGVVTVAAGALTFNRGDAVTVSNVISGTGTGAVVQGGAGTTTLSAANTYTNPTTVSNGTLLVTGTLASPVTVAAGGRLGGTGSTSATITFADGSYVLAGATTPTGANAVQGTGVVAGPTANGVNIVVPQASLGARTVDVVRYGGGAAPDLSTLNAAAYRNGTLADDTTNQKVTLAFTTDARTWAGGSGSWDTGTAGTWTGGDTAFFNGDAATFADPGAAATVTIAGVVSPGSVSVTNAANAYTFATGTTGAIAGTGSLTKAGTGTLTMTGTSANRYTGGTTINGGTLALGTGGTAAQTSSPQALGSGTVTVNAGGTLKLWIKNDATYTIGNPMVFDGGRLLGEDGNYILPGAITIGAGGMSVGTKWSGKLVTISGPITGGTLTAAGETTGSGAANTAVVLSGTNSYGSTTVTSGTLRIGNGGTTGTLGTGPVTLATGAVLNFNRADPFAVGNAITGAGAVTKTAGGTLSLTATSTYTGATTVSGGTLLVNGSLTASAVTAASGGTVGGTGSILSTLAVAAGGTVNPGLAGPAVGTLAAGTTTLAGTSAFDLGTPGASKAAPGVGDRVAVTGDLTLGGTISVLDMANASSAGSLGNGTYLLYTYTGTLSGAPTAITGPAAYTYTLDTTTPGSVFLNVVPEPTSAGLLGVATVGLLARRRRK